MIIKHIFYLKLENILFGLVWFCFNRKIHYLMLKKTWTEKKLLKPNNSSVLQGYLVLH